LKTYKYILVLTLLVIFNSCGGSETKLSKKPTNQPETTVDDGMIQVDLPSCDVGSKKTFVYELLHDSYYWADEIGESSIDLFADSSALLDGLKSDKDRFSFIMDYSSAKTINNSLTDRSFTDKESIVDWTVPVRRS
jgi:hypothetical protein